MGRVQVPNGRRAHREGTFSSLQAEADGTGTRSAIRNRWVSSLASYLSTHGFKKSTQALLPGDSKSPLSKQPLSTLHSPPCSPTQKKLTCSRSGEGCKICLGQRKPAKGKPNLGPGTKVLKWAPHPLSKKPSFPCMSIDARQGVHTPFGPLLIASPTRTHTSVFEAKSALFQRLGLVSYHSKRTPKTCTSKERLKDLTPSPPFPLTVPIRFQSRRLKAPRDMTCRPPCFLFVIDPLPPPFTFLCF